MQNPSANFVYIPPSYPGPVALDSVPSEELRDYHKNSCIQFNIGTHSFLKKIDEGKERNNARKLDESSPEI